MVDFEKYSATKVIWDFKIDELEFTCQELNIGEEVDLFNYYIDSDGKENIAKMRMVQATKLIKHPFEPEWIKKIYKDFYPEKKLSDYTTWESLSSIERIKFLSKLESSFVSKILNEVGKHYIAKEETVKN